MDWIDIMVAIIVTVFVVGGVLALYADSVNHPWGEDDDKDTN